MGGVSIGPLAFSAERAAVLAGLLVLFVMAGLLARRAGPGLNRWASLATLAGVLAARAGFVAAHWDVFRAAPLSVLAFWQGGFSPFWGAVGLALASLWLLGRERALILPAGLSLALAVTGWNVVVQLGRGNPAALPEDLVLSDLDGRPVAPGSWQGRPMVLNLWASWCPPCRREMPMMAEVAASGTGVDLHFINQGEGPGVIRGYLSGEGIVIAPLLDHGMRMMRHFDVQGLPATLFIGADGRLRSAHLGEISRAGLLAGIAELRKDLP